MSDIARHVAQYVELEFVPLRIQDAFDPEWWREVHTSLAESNFSVDMTSEGELFPQTCSSSYVTGCR